MKKKTKKFGNKVAGNSKKQNAEGSNYGYMKLPKGIGVFKEEPSGASLIDILPYAVTDKRHPDRDDSQEIAIPDELWYKRPFKIHRQVGVNNETIVCPKSIGRPCKICDYRIQRMNEGAPKEETDVYKQSLRNLYIVIPKELKKFKTEYEEKPHIWNISQAMFQKLLNEEIAENEDYGIFPDLEEGLSLRIRWASKTIGKSKPFAEASRIDFEERDAQYDESILKTVPDLDKVLIVLSTDEIERMFFELEDEPESTDKVKDPKEKPAASKKEKKTEPKKEEKDDPPFDPDENECIACEGTGTNSKGRECRICGGTGVKPDKEEKEPGKEENPKPASDTECPKGHEWGTDCEEYPDDCDDCDLWDKCLTAKEENA